MNRVCRAHEPHVLIQACQERGNGGICVRRVAGRRYLSRQSEAVSAARPRWRAKNRAELSRSYSGTG
jgi:hypothetical protein